MVFTALRRLQCNFKAITQMQNSEDIVIKTTAEYLHEFSTKYNDNKETGAKKSIFVCTNEELKLN